MDTETVQIPVKEFAPHRWHVEVLADTHPYQSLCWHRRSRKTTLGLNKLIRACVSTKNETFAYIGPTYKQAKKTVVTDPLMLKRFLPPQILKKPFNETELRAEFITGSVLHILGADDPDSLRGPRFKGVVLDEWALMKRSIFEEILSPVLREVQGWCQFQFTPKGKNHAWEFHQRGLNNPTSPWRSWTLPASQSGLIPDTALAEIKAEMRHEGLYAQEMECAFLDSAQGVFQGYQLCVSGELEGAIRGRRYVMGIDLGRHHDATVLTVMDVETRQVVAWKRLTDTNWGLQKMGIAELAHAYGRPLLVIDGTGVGDPIAEDLSQLGFNVEPFHFTESSKRVLVDGLRVALADRLITFPKIDQLIEELGYFEIKLKPDGTLTSPPRYGAPDGEGFFDDCVISLALAVSGLKGNLYVPSHPQADTDYEDLVVNAPVNAGYGFGD